MDNTSATGLQAQVSRLEHEVHALRTQIHASDDETITISEYILTRLEQIGVESIFGVPGDFNMPFLDYVEDHPKIKWIGCCNELNASHAADGYSRVKEHGIGVIVTTFGVGELIAMNGVAGAFSEMVPVLHIVGVPSTLQQKQKPILHHTLGDGRFDAYTKAAAQTTIAQAAIMDRVTAGPEIDRVLAQAITTARPVYLTLPMDLVSTKISAKRLKVELPRSPPPNDPEVEAFVLDEIVKLVEEADQDVVILTDACVIRHHVRQEVNDLIHKTHFPVYSSPMGKTSVNENYERYGGVYVGLNSHPKIKEKVENAKLILSIGSLKSDFNTGMFTYSVPTSRTVELHSGHTLIRHAQFPGIGMKKLLPKLTERLHKFKEDAKQLPLPQYKALIPDEKDDIISQAYFWPRMGQFFKPKDVIVAETGTSSFGILDVELPEDSIFVAQILFGSIGWSVGTTLGAAVAARERHLGRTILFVGDGSLQVTAQELSTMTAKGVHPILFVLNNDGYVIERHLHGMDREYNNIVGWKYTSLLTTFGDKDGSRSRSYTVHNKKELNDLLEDETFAKADKIQLVEVMMDRYDAPRALKASAQLSEAMAKRIAEQDSEA